MRMSDLQKWATDVLPEDFTYVTDKPYKIKVYRASFGEFVKAYIEHLRVSWWRRGVKWREVERKMRGILDNRSAITWYERIDE